MSKGTVWKWVRMFNEGRENVHDEERSGHPSLITEELVRCIDEKVRSNRRFAISDLSMNFQNISRSLLHEIVTELLYYKKLSLRCVPKTYVHRTIKNGNAWEQPWSVCCFRSQAAKFYEAGCCN
ncbi:hypothetical protein AVEN_205016-1 [Araneus ventricosus]|uniref:Mos1 transposase HTH domain-containing protein n=1 Tax=Araneus ventricosus TaxID=182803 RepID=A0A4Y2RZF1_ARAVE|nr:hypothetical protein AVEN_251556-1 [Araneus ventricosus]GBN81092.1 hypothetical protein AVEN_205016-1 [Araneus ventricosus]